MFNQNDNDDWMFKDRYIQEESRNLHYYHSAVHNMQRETRRDNDDGDGDERQCRNMIEPVSLCGLFSFFFFLSFSLSSVQSIKRETQKKKRNVHASIYYY